MFNLIAAALIASHIPCSDVAGTAGVYMEFRQQEQVSVRFLLEQVKPGEFASTQIAIISGMTEVPLYSTPEHQRRAVAQYEDQWLRICMKERSGK